MPWSLTTHVELTGPGQRAQAVKHLSSKFKTRRKKINPDGIPGWGDRKTPGAHCSKPNLLGELRPLRGPVSKNKTYSA